jgi:hypothetical protein
MTNSTIILLMFIGIAVFLIAGIVYAIRQKNIHCSGSFASMAAMHDFQTKEKQQAMETIIEQKSDKKMEEQESGEGKEDT